MGNWDYTPEETARISAGEYRLEVLSAEEKVSSNGNQMIVVTVRPNCSSIKIRHYIVKNQYFNRNMTEFFDSFGIARGDFSLPSWTGAVGAGRLKEEDGYLKVAYFLPPARAEKLPEWSGEIPERQTITSFEGEGFTEVDDLEEIPF